MDDNRYPHRGEIAFREQDPAGEGDRGFPSAIATLLDAPRTESVEQIWDLFLTSFGDTLLKTAAYAHRRRGPFQDAHDATMDAYAFILERLRHDDFRRLRAFPGGDEAALTRWLIVVARRLCTDFWRRRYGRVRPSTSDLDRDTRRRLVDEIWDPREASEFPAGKSSNPEWEFRFLERRRALETASAELDARDRLLLAFRFEEGLSARRIADLMDFPSPFHVYRQLNRILGGLRKRMESLGFDDPGP